jgi:hypothetical protein
MRIIPTVRSLLFAAVIVAMSAASFAQVGISITIGPPPIPIYEQPLCPEEGYLWTPGYWAYDYDDDDYYWVPGTWVLAPEVGFLWTPGYWSWNDAAFVWYEGYWGPRVGFYGGIVYGFGYFGEGYEGGRWENGRFFYNRTVNNVNITNIHNVYNTTVINNTTTVNRVSFNGGSGGTTARPRPEEEAAAHERHIPPVPVQTQHAQAARSNPQQRATVNRGKPPIAATPKPGALNDRGVVPAKKEGGAWTPPSNRRAAQPRAGAPSPTPESNSRPTTAVHPRDLPPRERPAPPTTGNPKADKKYQQQQEKLYAKQDQERQKLQQKQEQEHQRMAQLKADEARQQRTEQQHQQQTQRLEQKHVQQQQQLQQRQPPPNRSPSRPPK